MDAGSDRVLESEKNQHRAQGPAHKISGLTLFRYDRRESATDNKTPNSFWNLGEPEA